MLGFYENFPLNIHRTELFSTSLSSISLQHKLVKVLHDINRREFSFEEVTCPTVPKCTIIFEAGIAEARTFNYIDEEEIQKVFTALKKAPFQTMDFFCAVRYYKGAQKNKMPLKFDYYMIRILFGKSSLEIQVFHERGPRYISPEDIIAFLVNEVNKTSTQRTLKRAAVEI